MSAVKVMWLSIDVEQVISGRDFGNPGWSILLLMSPVLLSCSGIMSSIFSPIASCSQISTYGKLLSVLCSPLTISGSKKRSLTITPSPVWWNA